MKLVEKYQFELTLIVGMLFLTKFVLLGYNLLGFYEFNNYFLTH